MSGLYPSPPGPLSPKQPTRGEGEKKRWDHANSLGLAKRNDLRVIAALKLELESDCIGYLAIEAAELIASNELYPLLVDLRGWWDIDIDLLERSIEASKQ
ncbi:MAG: hypothetical protein NTU79_02270 [Planctomycetota bacterium]|nr:hypothetical protein [Planctomycetota bacterium]